MRLGVRGHVRAFESGDASPHSKAASPKLSFIRPRRARSMEIRRFPQIQIYESGKKEIRKWGRGFLRSCFPD